MLNKITETLNIQVRIPTSAHGFAWVEMASFLLVGIVPH